MHLDNFIPQFFYLFFSLLFLYFISYPLSFLNKFSQTRLFALIAISSHTSISVIAAFIIIYTINAGFVFDLNNIVLVSFILCYFYDVATLYLIKKKDNSLKNYKYFFIPVVISLIIFYFLFNGDKIFKLHKYCKPTSTNKIYNCLYKNNDIYTGELNSFNRNGQGNYTFYNTKVNYSGGWKNGMFHGKGILIENGKKYLVEYDNNKEISRK
jgi:hypothetical protein